MQTRRFDVTVFVLVTGDITRASAVQDPVEQLREPKLSPGKKG
jgi:hypothetical protein